MAEEPHPCGCGFRLDIRNNSSSGIAAMGQCHGGAQNRGEVALRDMVWCHGGVGDVRGLSQPHWC